MITAHDNALSFVKSHPAFFFRDGIPDPVACVQCLFAEIIALGGEDITIRRASDWWLVSSAIDWFEGVALDVLFHQLIPLPQLAQNASRFEVVVAAYAACVATALRTQLPVVISGDAPFDDIWELIPPGHTRALAFRFPGK